MRKPIAVAAGSSSFNSVVAVCDDGTLWRYDGEGWRLLPPIPQPEIAEPNSAALPVERLRTGFEYMEVEHLETSPQAITDMRMTPKPGPALRRDKGTKA